jgi:hypothetical protein
MAAFSAGREGGREGRREAGTKGGRKVRRGGGRERTFEKCEGSPHPMHKKGRVSKKGRGK